MKLILVFVLFLSVAYTHEPWEYDQYGPAKKLIDELNDIQLEIRKEQLHHNEDNDEQTEDCNNEFDARNTSIDEADDALEESTNHLADCTIALGTAQVDLKDTGYYLEEILANIANLKAIRSAQAQAYAKRDAQLEVAINAVVGAYPIIEELAASTTSFAQMSKYMTKTFKHVNKVQQGGAMANVLTALVQLKSKVSPDEAAQVKQMFQRLEGQLRQSKQEQTVIENTRISEYNINLQKTQQVADKLSKTHEELILYVASLEQCITTENEILKSANAKLTINTDLLAQATTLCNEYWAEYTRATNARTKEIEEIEELKAFVAAKANQFGQYGPDETGITSALKGADYLKSKAEGESFMELARKKVAKLGKLQKQKLDAEVAYSTNLKPNMRRRK